MKRRWGTSIFIFIIILLSISLVQCTRSSQEQSDIGTGITEEGTPDYSEDSSSDKSGEKKVVTNIYMAIETVEFDTTVEKLEAAVKNQGGYIENSNIGYSNYIGREVYKSGSFTARIPSEKEEIFKKEALKLGNVTAESTSKADITKTYRDTESRLKVLEVKETRILELLEKATAIEDIIKLEDSLNEVIYEKEQLKSEISSMDSQVSLSTVEISILEVARYSTGNTPDTGFWEKASDAFENSFYVFKLVLGKLVIFAIYAFPFLVLAFLLYIGIRRIALRHRKK